MGKQTIQEVAKILVEKNGLAPKDANRFATEFFNLIMQRLQQGDQVKVKGLGTFKIIDVDDRESVNVNTGERVLIEGHPKITFAPDALMKELTDRDKGVFTLRNTDAPLRMDGRPGFYLIKVKGDNGLFLHISVTLKEPKAAASLDSNHDFEGISVQFFQGTGKLFCRAEWDVKKNKDKLEHPQPHWHWGEEKEAEKSQTFAATVTGTVQRGGFMEVLSTDEPSLPSIDFQELHYAMASKWPMQDRAVEDFNEQRLYMWLKNCMANVIDQYNYQVNKGGFESSKTW